MSYSWLIMLPVVRLSLFSSVRRELLVCAKTWRLSVGAGKPSTRVTVPLKLNTQLQNCRLMKGALMFNSYTNPLPTCSTVTTSTTEITPSPSTSSVMFYTPHLFSQLISDGEHLFSHIMSPILPMPITIFSLSYLLQDAQTVSHSWQDVQQSWALCWRSPPPSWWHLWWHQPSCHISLIFTAYL